MPNLSRVETILRNTIDGEEYSGVTMSRVEELLKELNELIIEGGGGGGGGDSYTKAQIDAMIGEIEDQIDNIYDKDDVDTLIDTLEGMITSLSSNVYTKTEVNNLISELEQDIDWKEAVDYFTDLAITYPDAEEGWTASVLNSDVDHEEGVYRYNGTSWVEIYKLTPMATTTTDGLMSKEQVIQLNSLDADLDDLSLMIPSKASSSNKLATNNDIISVSGRVTTVEGLLDGHTVATNVPANAIFTDTVYDDTELSGRVDDTEEAIDDLQDTTKHLSEGDTVYPYTPKIEIEDALGINAKDVKVKIEAVQSGSGTPSPANVRPFIGWDFCRIDNTGKNLWNPNDYYFGYIPDATALAGSATAKSAIIKCKPNTVYAIYKPIGNRFRLCYTKEYPATGVSVYGFMEDDPQNGGGVLTTGEGAEYIVAFVYTASDVSYTYTWEDVQNSLMVVESQTIPSVYESYKGKTYTINLGGTIYVGELDVTKGILTADYSLKEFDGSNDETITRLDTTEQDKKRFGLTIPDCKTYTLEAEELTGEIWCNQLVETTNINTYYALGEGIHYRITNVHEAVVYIEGISSVEDMRTYLETEPLQVLYRLAETKIIQLTPRQIQLLDGYNYLQANTGDIQVTTGDIESTIKQTESILDDISLKVYNVIGSDNSAFHNSIYRGRCLGNVVTENQYNAINEGTFEDMFIGDYWTINGVNWRIAHFDYWINTGNVSTTKHHVVIVPDTNLYTAQMNTSDTTSGGYYNSEMRGAANYTDQENGGTLKQAYSIITSAFGNSHILSHRELLTSTVVDGKSTGVVWEDSTVELMSEIMIYGSLINSLLGTDKEAGIDKEQFALFRFNHSAMVIRTASTWLRGVVDASKFASIAYPGNAGSGNATDLRGVRPCFAIVKE